MYLYHDLRISINIKNMCFNIILNILNIKYYQHALVIFLNKKYSILLTKFKLLILSFQKLISPTSKKGFVSYQNNTTSKNS